MIDSRNNITRHSVDLKGNECGIKTLILRRLKCTFIDLSDHLLHLCSESKNNLFRGSQYKLVIRKDVTQIPEACFRCVNNSELESSENSVVNDLGKPSNPVLKVWRTRTVLQ